MEIMKFKKYISMYESLKDISLNKILDKISRKVSISDREKKFLDNFDKIEDRDYVMLSKDPITKIINNLIESGRKVICNLYDRDGVIGLGIESIDYDFQSNSCNINLKGGETFNLEDRFLYNIIYDIDKSEYSLEFDSEYFEKVEINK